MPREPCPNAKIIKNLCTFACSDPAVTPAVNLNLSVASDDLPPLSPTPAGQSESNCTSFPAGGTTTTLERGNTVQCDQYNGILSLVQQQKVLHTTCREICCFKLPFNLYNIVLDNFLDIFLYSIIIPLSTVKPISH